MGRTKHDPLRWQGGQVGPARPGLDPWGPGEVAAIGHITR